MFIGHYAIAMLGKKYSPQLSLGTLFLSVQLVDLLWPIFLLAGLEHVKIEPGNTAFTPLNMINYPITHSLLGGIIWGGILAFIYYMVKKVKRSSIILGIGVVSHWILDLLMHKPDLPIYPGGAKYGFGLWNSVPGTFVVELTLFAFGIYTYIKLTKPKDKTGNWLFWGLIVFLLSAWLSSAFGPPPPNVNVLAASALLLWLLVPWGYWIDRHRTIR
ncbi:MAG: hypothetical protein IH880_06545 [Candidatus Marinimicrobia bacterium]|nr:hypothetical protein [Candidatus Neomarinimicrobiota bacterium]